jgi:serine phosphatase RsbU (regulator of sigma subunit)
VHPLLKRQLKRSGIEDEAGIPAEWKALLDRVSASYTETEHDRYLLERSLDLTSKEMDGLNRLVQEERDRLERELATVARIQQSILPKQLVADGVDIAARMISAEAVSGDYYDVLPVPAGCFIGIGDVAGHGLAAGMIMLMIESIVAALVKNDVNMMPRVAVNVLNGVMYENIRHRLEQDEHVTFTLFRVEKNGCVTFAGAHEDVIVYRARHRECEIFPTPGVWLGAQRDIEKLTRDNVLDLEDGDTMVLYTDGVVEARNAAGDERGLGPLVDDIVRLHDRPVRVICDGILDSLLAWAPKLADDATVLVLRHSR